MLLTDATATANIAKRLASLVRPPCIIFLQGELGAGKTTFSRNFINSLGYTGIVNSPTYNLVHLYPTPKYTIYHFDLYRLSSRDTQTIELFSEYFEDNGICLIEWPENALAALPVANITINLKYADKMRSLELVTDSQHNHLKSLLTCP
jgi:tRNA threonylcarbamoyladenosine biosynthesis protein TsaE